MSLHAHHAAAVRVIAAAAVLDLLLGAAFGAADHIGTGNGLYFATSVATTSGNSPFFPHGWLAYTLAVAMHVTMIPLWLAAFSLLTSGLAASRTEESEARIKDHAAVLVKAHAQPGTAAKLDHLSGKVDGLAGAVNSVMAARAQRDSGPSAAESVSALRDELSLLIRAVTPPAASAAAASGPSPAAGGGSDGEGAAARRPSRKPKGAAG